MSQNIDVNVAAHRQRASERVSASGRLQEAVQPNETTNPTRWERLSNFFKWETVTMPHKTVDKGFVVTPTIAAVLLAAFLGAVGWAYKSSTSDSRETRDAVIRMETILNERTRYFEREQDKSQAELKDERQVAAMYRENQDRKRMQLLIALRAKGVNIALE